MNLLGPETAADKQTLVGTVGPFPCSPQKNAHREVGVFIGANNGLTRSVGPAGPDAVQCAAEVGVSVPLIDARDLAGTTRGGIAAGVRVAFAR